MLAELVIIIILISIGLKLILILTTGRHTSQVCLIGKTALITGGNSGIGYETALQLAGRGCRVIIADKNNCDQSKENIINETNNRNIVAKQFDLASLSSVRNLAQDIIKTEKRLDILINNAGALGLDFGYTQDGLHFEMQVNHFGAFLLTHLLVDLLKKSAPSRIIFVSSFVACFSNLKPEQLNSPPTETLFFPKFMDYCNTKLCNIISARGFADKLKGTGVTSNSLYPGVVCTPIFVNDYYQNLFTSYIGKALWNVVFGLFKWYNKSPFEGAQTTVHLAIAKEVESITGKYFMDCKTFITPSKANNIEFSNQIWKLSEDFVKLSDHEKLCESTTNS